MTRTQVHLGAGAFARGHTWLGTARAEEGGAREWGIVAVAQRSDRVIDALRRKDWAYTVVERDEESVAATRVEAVADGVVAQRDPAALLAVLRDERTEVVTITATESAYPRTRDGALDRAAVADDLRDGGTRSLVAQVAATARERQRAGAGPVTFVVCDNILNGGDVLRGLGIEFAEARGDAQIADWLREHATFPNAVVDRIVPAPTAQIREEARAETGADDAALVATEPFFRWVIQDAFAAGRPQWERAGALVVEDVGPWQAVKLNLVNAPHSWLAYLGLLAGHDTTFSAMQDAVLRRGLEKAFDEDLLPSVPPGAEVSPRAEAESSLTRFANPRIEHRLEQIATGGAHKLAQRMTAPVRAAADEGREARWLALGVAAWAECAARGVIDEPELHRGPGGGPPARAVVTAAGLDAAASGAFVSAVQDEWDRLSRHGVHDAVRRLLERKGTS